MAEEGNSEEMKKLHDFQERGYDGDQEDPTNW